MSTNLAILLSPHIERLLCIFYQNHSSNETPPASADVIEQAEKFKAEANELFKNEKYTAAADLYTQAINLNPTNAVYYANRSIANHRIENFGKHLTFSSKV